MFGRKRRHGAVNWKTNLAALWICQFLSLAAFSFCIPFLPLYLRETGIVPVDEVQAWAGVLLAAPSFSMMIMAPIWGALGDRYGRKMMLVRASLAGAFVLYLMGVVGNIEALIILRVLQGAFTGTVPAAQTLVATNTPDKNQGFAIGVLMAAVNAGTMAGVTLGGLSAKYYGAAFSFKIGGFMLLGSTLLALAAVRENFTRPEPRIDLTRSARLRHRRESFTNFRSGLPVLAVIGVVSFIQTFDGPFLSLYVDELYRARIGDAIAGISDAAVTGNVYGVTGLVSAAASLAAIAGSIATGTLLDRNLPRWVWPLAAGLAGVGALWVAGSESLYSLTGGRAVYLFFMSGLASVLVVILGRLTPSSKRGAALGWSMTVRSIGWGLAPLVGAFSANHFGYDFTFIVLACLCFCAIPMFIHLVRRYAAAFSAYDDDPPSIGSVGASNVSTPGGQGRMG
ncbi:MAG: MFS transporter [Planctomycetes bacterium]|nr:MFS transporter [Planctomycetota bacterium]